MVTPDRRDGADGLSGEFLFKTVVQLLLFLNPYNKSFFFFFFVKVSVGSGATSSYASTADSELKFTRKFSQRYRWRCCIIETLLVFLLIFSLSMYAGCKCFVSIIILYYSIIILLLFYIIILFLLYYILYYSITNYYY